MILIIISVELELFDLSKWFFSEQCYFSDLRNLMGFMMIKMTKNYMKKLTYGYRVQK